MTAIFIIENKETKKTVISPVRNFLSKKIYTNVIQRLSSVLGVKSNTMARYFRFHRW